jgi:hypothetical protein
VTTRKVPTIRVVLSRSHANQLMRICTSYQRDPMVDHQDKEILLRLARRIEYQLASAGRMP